jgi:hypothetical protein
MAGLDLRLTGHARSQARAAALVIGQGAQCAVPLRAVFIDTGGW